MWSNFVRVTYTPFDVWKLATASFTIYNIQDRHYTHEHLDYVTNDTGNFKAAQPTPIYQNA
jgi:hypothetical protein